MAKALSRSRFIVHVCSSNTVLLLGMEAVEQKGPFGLGDRKHWD